MPKQIHVLIAVALPLMALAFGVARSEYRLSGSEDWQFVVRGYDPRDLLRGHYIQYRIDFNEQDGMSCENDDPECCLCLTRSSDESAGSIGAVPSTRRMACGEARRSCDGTLRTSFIPTLTRYYVPESRAKDIERQLQEAMRDRDARIVLAIDGMGRPHIRELRVDGKALE